MSFILGHFPRQRVFLECTTVHDRISVVLCAKFKDLTEMNAIGDEISIGFRLICNSITGPAMNKWMLLARKCEMHDDLAL